MIPGFLVFWLPRFYIKAIIQQSRKHNKIQNKINSYKFLKPFLVPREDVGGTELKGEGSDWGSLCVYAFVHMTVCLCVKVRGVRKTFPVLYCPKTGGNKHLQAPALDCECVWGVGIWHPAPGHKKCRKGRLNLSAALTHIQTHMGMCTQPYLLRIVLEVRLWDIENKWCGEAQSTEL